MKVVVIGPTKLTRACIDEIVRQKCQIQAVFALDKTLAHKKARFTLFTDQAEKYGFDLHETKNIKENVELIKDYKPDLILEAGWSQIIPKSILDIPKLGTIGLHGAPLPKIRGGASLNWALIRGEKEWGVTLYYLAEHVDRGDIIGVHPFKIEDRDDIETVHCKSDLASVELLRKYLPEIKKNKAPKIPQTGDFIFLPQRKTDDSIIDWDKTSLELYNWIRALTHPFPGAFTFLKKQKIYVWRSNISITNIDMKNTPGTIEKILDGCGIQVSTKNGSIILTRLQLENGVEMWADDFVKKYKMVVGDCFG